MLVYNDNDDNNNGNNDGMMTQVSHFANHSRGARG